MKVLKGIVILMSVVLVVGFTTLLLQWKSKHDAQSAPANVAVDVVSPTESEAPLELVSQAVPVPTPVTNALVPLPAGARVIASNAAGRLLDVLVENRDGSRDLYQIARKDGAVLGILRFREEGP